MADIKLVVMDGIWADWLGDYEAVSEQITAVAARKATGTALTATEPARANVLQCVA